MAKSLEITKNMVLFLPKNTSVDELIGKLEAYPQLRNDGCLTIELEQLAFGNATKVLLVSTADISNINAQNI